VKATAVGENCLDRKLLHHGEEVEQSHRHRSTVNFRGKTFLPENMYEKFKNARILVDPKIIKIPEFCDICQKN